MIRFYERGGICFLSGLFFCLFCWKYRPPFPKIPSYKGYFIQHKPMHMMPSTNKFWWVTFSTGRQTWQTSRGSFKGCKGSIFLLPSKFIMFICFFLLLCEFTIIYWFSIILTHFAELSYSSIFSYFLSNAKSLFIQGTADIRQIAKNVHDLQVAKNLIFFHSRLHLIIKSVSKVLKNHLNFPNIRAYGLIARKPIILHLN